MTKQEAPKAARPQTSFYLNDTEYTILDSNDEKELEVAVHDVTEWMERNDGNGKTDEEKDELYKKAQGYWKILAESLQNSKFNLYLDKGQCNFLVDLLRKKVEYDVNSVFLAIEIKDIVDEMATTKYSNDNQLQPFVVTATQVTYLYHLINKHKIKGLGKEVFYFVEILTRIGQISKLINYYDIAVKGFSSSIQQWVAGFESPEESDGPQDPQPQVITHDIELS